MARQRNVAAREQRTAVEVYRRFLQCKADGVFTPEELEWIEEAHEENLDACDRTVQTMRLIGCAIETGMEGRRFQQEYKAWTVIRGGAGMDTHDTA